MPKCTLKKKSIGPGCLRPVVSDLHWRRVTDSLEILGMIGHLKIVGMFERVRRTLLIAELRMKMKITFLIFEHKYCQRFPKTFSQYQHLQPRTFLAIEISLLASLSHTPNTSCHTLVEVAFSHFPLLPREISDIGHRSPIDANFALVNHCNIWEDKIFSAFEKFLFLKHI